MMERLASDDALRERLCAGAVQWARSFSWDSEAEVMLELLQQAAQASAAIP
jgi:hypothetical protein